MVAVAENTTAVVLSTVTVAGNEVLGMVSCCDAFKGYEVDSRGQGDCLVERCDVWYIDPGSAEHLDIGSSTTVGVTHSNIHEDVIESVVDAEETFVQPRLSVARAHTCKTSIGYGHDRREGQGRSHGKE